MCGILDANSAHEVFGTSITPAGKDFRDWIDSVRGALVVGGKQLEELMRAASVGFELWAEEAGRDGRLRRTDHDSVEAETARLRQSGDCKSNDEHIIALALVSGARLLYSHDKDLHSDFKSLLTGLRGKVLPTGTSNNARQARRILLESEELCRPNRCGRRR